MNVDFYAAKIQVQVMRHRENIEYAYERYPDTTRFWAFIDLVASSNYRLLNGAAKGYLRGETFSMLINEVMTPYPGIDLLKEMGDGVLLSADSLRPLLETLVLSDLVAYQMRLSAGDEKFPFAIRAGISYGPVKKLNRPHETPDYLGTPLDKLARILGIRNTKANLFLHESAYQSQEGIVSEYSDFLSISGAKSLSSEESKGMLQPVYYHELEIDKIKLKEFRSHFNPWHEKNEM